MVNSLRDLSGIAALHEIWDPVGGLNGIYERLKAYSQDQAPRACRFQRFMNRIQARRLDDFSADESLQDTEHRFVQ